MPSPTLIEQDAAAVVRDRTADVRDAAATDRDTTADDRDQVADDRDHIADDRDQVADDRDHVADHRDALAEERDRAAATRPDEVGDRVTAAHLERTLNARDAAAADRHHAWTDRAAWAQDRAGAEGDRTRAEDDRTRAEGDRTCAEGDRGDAEGDRSAASGDRGTAARYRRSADLDPLTGALHRGAGQAALLREMTRATRLHHPLVVAYIDVDEMKAVNDTGGHGAGDQLLRHVVGALRDAFRPGDTVVRQGGDEFLCILPGMALGTAATRMTQVNHALAITGSPGSVTAGFAQMQHGDTDDQLVHRADEDLYRTKPRHTPPTP